MTATKTTFTTTELAAMRLPGKPTTRQGWDSLVQDAQWEFKEVRGRGRGGKRREFIPPPEMAELIRRHLEAGATPEDRARSAVATASAEGPEGNNRVRPGRAGGAQSPVTAAAGSGKTAAAIEAMRFLLGEGIPDLDQDFYMRVLNAAGQVLGPPGSLVSKDAEPFLIRAMYARFLPSKTAVTDEQLVEHLRNQLEPWLNPPARPRRSPRM